MTLTGDPESPGFPGFPADPGIPGDPEGPCREQRNLSEDGIHSGRSQKFEYESNYISQ